MDDQDRILRLVGQFYDAALDPGLWDRALLDMAEFFGDSGILLGGVSDKGFEFCMATRVDFSVNDTPDGRAAMLPENNTTVRDFAWLPLCTPIRSTHSVDSRELERSMAYQVMMRPQGYHRQANALLLGRPDEYAAITVLRPFPHDEFEDDDLRKLSALLPHLQRAIQVQLRLTGVEMQRDGAMETLERLALGAVLLDGAGQVVFMNSAARAIVNQEDGLSARAGVLTAARPKESVALARLVGEAARTASGGGLAAGGAMSVSRPSMLRPFSLLVAPVRGQEYVLGVRDLPAAVVFLSDPERDTGAPEALLRELYGLTPAEAAVAAIVLQGRGLEFAAERLGVSHNTARTHLRRVFEKTGVRRQAELVRLVLSGPAGLNLS